MSGSGLAKFPLGVIKLAGSDVTHIDISNNDLKALPRDFCSFTQGSDEKFFIAKFGIIKLGRQFR